MTAQTAALPAAVISRNKPALNAGRIEGSMRVYQGAAFSINGGFQLTSDLYLPGTATMQLNGNASPPSTQFYLHPTHHHDPHPHH